MSGRVSHRRWLSAGGRFRRGNCCFELQRSTGAGVVEPAVFEGVLPDRATIAATAEEDVLAKMALPNEADLLEYPPRGGVGGTALSNHAPDAHPRKGVVDEGPSGLCGIPMPLIAGIEDAAKLIGLQLLGFDGLEVKVTDHPALGPELDRPERPALRSLDGHDTGLFCVDGHAWFELVDLRT